MSELPGWVISDEESVRAEVAEWRDLSPAERWKLATMCARDAMWAARASGRAAQILAHEDPPPASTLEALARLRRQAGWPRGDR